MLLHGRAPALSGAGTTFQHGKRPLAGTLPALTLVSSISSVKLQRLRHFHSNARVSCVLHYKTDAAEREQV
jgi:hypothetical protein